MSIPLSGLVGWYKADAIVGLTDGQYVTTWTDSSSAGHDMALLGGTGPVYNTNVINGLPVVTFTGDYSNEILYNNFTYGTPLTIVTIENHFSGVGTELSILGFQSDISAFVLWTPGKAAPPAVGRLSGER